MSQNPMPKLKLTTADVQIIKRRIWNGETREALAKEFSISVSELCSIGAGFRWKTVAWPDGSDGALPDARKAKIASARLRLKAKYKKHMQQELHVR
jgi:hypothetical protein